ncbi:hypothetical protein PV10_02522 [Exophiala mesophila]|uniref:Chitobiosyldiphosphodolichol beta-mannosyltransferase n=1 Tax=Exophiala mesophila TaxID=212818 RepID=A0A0D1WZ57_EXOME|nr:uncharacterized protein PV10_02522 [Exophiala mesophila]KIV94790.1 hypothetical protein PV10_02522 [Exophiala mesophila]
MVICPKTVMLLTVLVLISTLFTIFLLLLPSQRDPSEKICSVQVLVLGDIGRSPRMQYHALSIAKHGGQVQLIGYLESEPLPELLAHPGATIIPLTPSPRVLQTSNRTLFLLYAPLKVLLQLWFLWRALGYTSKPAKWLLVQNPPSIPTLLIASLISIARGTRLIIDWHNFGYSILALKLGARHPLVSLSKTYETFFAKAATANFAVTDAMAKIIKADFVTQSPVLTLHDRPAEIYRPLTQAQRAAFLENYSLLASHFKSILDNKARLLVSSTSWTADEDFGLFLDALSAYSASSTSLRTHLPELVVVITGKGPQKDFYLDRIRHLNASNALKRVTIYTDWLSFDNYALLLGSADLGISLHTSSSGVDLPMKVVDMFGAGLPVLGWSKFAAWPELVQEDVNGRGFESSDEMAEHLRQLCDPSSTQLARLKQGAQLESRRRWSSEWDAVAGKLLGFT